MTDAGDIAHLEAEFEAAVDALRAARRRLTDARRAVDPIKEGDEVEVKTYGRGFQVWRPAIVRAVRPEGWMTEYVVSLRLKSGEYSSHTTRSIESIRHPEAAE